MLKVVVGHSEDPEAQYAVEEVLDHCSKDLEGHQPQAGILFAAIDFEHALILSQINQEFPGIDLIGCTTDGEMSSILGFQQDSLTLMLFSSDTITISAGVGHQAKEDPAGAACQAVKQATGDDDTSPKVCITIPASYIPDGSTTNGEELLKGLELALGSDVPIVGGTAGDQYRFKSTVQFFRTEVLTNSIPILLFSGDIQASYGTACGWTPIGQKAVVTRAEGTTIYEIDGKPALDFYKCYLGDRPPTAETPLAVYDGDGELYYMRVPNTYDAQSGQINFLGDIPQQSTIQLTDINRDEVIAAAEQSFTTALERYPGTGSPEAVLLFSCCCRRWLLGTRAKEEYQLVRNALPKSVPICGFYTYGEFAPLEQQGVTHYHQETFVTLLLGSNSTGQ
ncbi:MAG: FIST N-terminal domain-containing protein [Cyanobacteria bacterium P01_F01_bin.3]